MLNPSPVKPYQSSKYKAYLSEPITRCPVREKGRIKTLVGKISNCLAQPPYETSLYIPSLITSPEKRSGMKPEDVYLLDRIRIVEADYMMVIADQTSFGIGGEVEMATSLNKPIVFFSREEKLSRFLIGTPANVLKNGVEGEGRHFIRYRDWRDLKPQLLPVIESVLNDLDEAEAEQLPLWNVSERLKVIREHRNLSREELARRTGLLSSQIRIWEMGLDEVRERMASYGDIDGVGAIEMNARQIEEWVNPGLAALHRLAFALGVGVAELIGEEDRPLVDKGPAKVAYSIGQQVADSRLLSLGQRALQFDITFREFSRLKAMLVDKVVMDIRMGHQAPGRFLHVISELEFRNALQIVRHRGA